MATMQELMAIANGAVRIPVRLLSPVEEMEAYAEANMRCDIVAGRTLDDDVVLTLDFSRYESHNRQFESASFYDRASLPRLTAREAGQYRELDEYHFDAAQSPEHYFVVEDEHRRALYDAYRASGAVTSYLAWLEERLIGTAA